MKAAKYSVLYSMLTLLSMVATGCQVVDPFGRDRSMRKQLTEGQTSLEKDSLPVQRAWNLAQIAEAEFYFGERQPAEKHATEALGLLTRREDSSGKTICDRDFDPYPYHKAHIVLGRLALRRGDRPSAKEHLLESANICSSPVLGSFGPNRKLADELLLLGERTVVIQYFKKTESFWTDGAERAKHFERAIFWGFRPDLG